MVNNKTMMRQLDKIGDTMGKIGDKITNVVEDFQKRINHQGIAETDTEIDPIVGIETTQEIVTGIEVEIEEDQTQERIEIINKDQVQVKDIMIEKISVTTVIEQVIQHMSVLNLRNYLKKQGKRIVLHDNDDIQDIAQAVQDLNTKIKQSETEQFNKQLKDSLCIEGNPKICPKTMSICFFLFET